MERRNPPAYTVKIIQGAVANSFFNEYYHQNPIRMNYNGNINTHPNTMFTRGITVAFLKKTNEILLTGWFSNYEKTKFQFARKKAILITEAFYCEAIDKILQALSTCETPGTLSFASDCFEDVLLLVENSEEIKQQIEKILSAILNQPLIGERFIVLSQEDNRFMVSDRADEHKHILNICTLEDARKIALIKNRALYI